MIMIKELFVCVLLACLTSAQVTDTESNAENYDWLTNLDGPDLDPFIVELLGKNLNEKKFYDQISAYYKTIDVKLDIRDASDVYLLYSKLKSFSKPCNNKHSFTLDMLASTYTHVVDDRLKKIIKFMIDKKPEQIYADKCISEADSLARKLYSKDEEAVELMTKISARIIPQTRHMMYYLDIKQDLGPLKQLSEDHELSKTVSRSKKLCGDLLGDQEARPMISILLDILQPTSNLYHNGIAEKLSKQIDENGPNAVKFISLVAFCKSK